MNQGNLYKERIEDTIVKEECKKRKTEETTKGEKIELDIHKPRNLDLGAPKKEDKE